MLEVGEEEDSVMSRVELVETDDQAGVSLDATGTQIIIRFARQGPLAVYFQVGDGPKETLGSDN